MWAGVNIKDFEESIYYNFYSKHDIEIIRGKDNISLLDLKRLINKAKKIGDITVEYSLVEMYDELLNTPPETHPPLPSREELSKRYNAVLLAAENNLHRKAKAASGH